MIYYQRYALAFTTIKLSIVARGGIEYGGMSLKAF